MGFLGFVLLVIGTLLVLYSRVWGIYDSTLEAMGATALKKIAGIIGGFMSIIGLLSMLGSCAAR